MKNVVSWNNLVLEASCQKKLTCLVGVKLTSVKADSGIVFEPLQPVADRKVLFCEELIPVFLLLIKSDIIDSSLETYSLKDFNVKVEKILKGSLDFIPSPSPSIKIQIIGRKVYLR